MSNFLTGKASVDRPWLKHYPQMLLDMLQLPPCTLGQYLQFNMPSPNTVAIHYYGTDITWQQIFARADLCAKALKALGFGAGDQIPCFLRSVPEFVYLLLAAERIGASLLCRDNTIEENVEAVAKSGATAIFAHDFLTQSDLDAYLAGSKVKKVILLNPTACCGKNKMPGYILRSLESNYVSIRPRGNAVLDWADFLALGRGYTGPVDAPMDLDRPLFRCYTSGSTGPSKQVIHSARTMVGVLGQMNFYGGADFRPTWMVTILPPALVAVVVSMMLLPLASNKLLILNPWVDVYDIDLEFMRYKPNNWPMIPMFVEVLMNSKRIPADFDMSFLLSAGAGAEGTNNTQLRRVRAFLDSHNCHVPFTTGYGSSEAGSNVTFHISGRPAGNCNMGCPMPLTDVAIFKPGTTQELDYNMDGEICVTGPGIMVGYDNEAATAKALQLHPDGKVWMHMGDIGHMDEEGHIYVMGRGTNRRFGGGFLDTLPMENMLADANIPGIIDQFFVNIPDPDHPGYVEPHLYVVLEDDVTLESICAALPTALKRHMMPVQLTQLPERPFWHFKTNRIGLTNEVLASRKRTIRLG